MSNERALLLLERLQEDESLRGDLQDPAATALLDWASARIREVAADETRADALVNADVRAIRQAARMAASAAVDDPQQVVAMAAAALQRAAMRGPVTSAPPAAPRMAQPFRRRRPTPRFPARRMSREERS